MPDDASQNCSDGPGNAAPADVWLPRSPAAGSTSGYTSLSLTFSSNKMVCNCALAMIISTILVPATALHTAPTRKYLGGLLPKGALEGTCRCGGALSLCACSSLAGMLSAEVALHIRQYPGSYLSGGILLHWHAHAATAPSACCPHPGQEMDQVHHINGCQCCREGIVMLGREIGGSQVRSKGMVDIQAVEAGLHLCDCPFRPAACGTTVRGGGW